MASSNIDRIKTQDVILEEFKKVHEDTYDYSEVKYVKGVLPVKIICKEHGEFFQKPYIHKKGIGCKKCGYKRVSEKLSSSKECFVDKANKVHNFKYNYTKTIYIKDIEEVTILCEVHGEFKIKANTHLNGVGCKKCGNLKIAQERTYSIDNFKELGNLKHNNFYNYDKSVYTGSLSKITITCPIHGDFEQIASNHLQGNGCQKCAIEKKGYSRTDFIHRANGRECILYLLRCFNKDEEFYKIGITSLSIKKRYNKKSSLPYNHEVVETVTGKAGEIYDLEKKYLKKYIDYKYSPKISFKGFSECIKKDNLTLN